MGLLQRHLGAGESNTELSHRLATRDDVPSLKPMASRAIDELQPDYLDATQIAASHAVMAWRIS
jgi:hypothetical protein